VTRVLYDAFSPDNIPAGAECVAFYVDQISEADAATRWPLSTLVSIARTVAEGALVADCESGDLTIAQLVAWVQRMRAAGRPHPWVYCSQSPWPNARQQFVAAGVPEPFWWIAAPGPSLALLPGTVATQCLYEGAYDVSALAYDIPGLDPGPDTGPNPTEEDGMPTTEQMIVDIWAALGGAAIDPNGAGVQYLGWTRDVTAALEALQASVTELQTAVGVLTPGGGAGPLEITLTGTAAPPSPAAEPPAA